MKRRKLLQTATIAASSLLVPIGLNSWALRGVAQSNNRKRMIVVFLRGAIDGLSLVVPHQESKYYEARPNIAVPYPQEPEGILDLDGFFGLHPDLVNVMPLWKNKSLAFIHSSGSKDETRSHFDAQDYMETGTPGTKTTKDGWMNRVLAVLPQDTPTQAVSVGNSTPRILEGKMNVASLAPGRSGTNRLPLDRPRISSAFDRLYDGKDPLSKAYQEGRKAREIILNELSSEMISASGDAPLVNNFSQDAKKVAKLMVGDAKTQLAFMDFGGWDSHINQKNILHRFLQPLGDGLATLAHNLGSLYSDTVIVVMSEFGRTVKENGNRGTDHGHGNVMWVLGGRVNGGQVYGQWLGLDESQLYEGRDLAVTTDFRESIATILEQHMKISDSHLKQIFPGYMRSNQLSALLKT